MKTTTERRNDRLDRLQNKLVKVTNRIEGRIDRTEKLLLLGAIANNLKIEVVFEDEPAFAELFNKVWPVLEPTLQWLKSLQVTGEKTDDALQAAIDIGWRISTGEASLQEQTLWLKKFDQIWETVKVALEIIKLFVKEKIDDVIDQIILIGDWISDEDYEIS